MSKKHLDKFKLRKEAWRRWGHYKQIIQAARNWVRKTKTLTELNLDRNVKDNQSFSRHINDERKIGLLQKETWRTKIGKTEILNNFFYIGLKWQVLQSCHPGYRRLRQV